MLAKQFDIPYFAHMQLDPARFPEGESLSPSALRRAPVRYSLVFRIPTWAPDNVMLILRTDLGSPVGRPPFKVLPYGAVGASEDSDNAASDELDEDFVPRVSHRIQSSNVF